MRNAYFTGIWKRAAAEQTDVADGVMRIAKRSPGNERLFGIEQTGDAVDLGRLDRFFEHKRRDDCWDAFRQHRFARTRRANHQDVVTARDGYLDRALDVALAFHGAEIDIVTLARRKEFAQSGACRQKRNFAAQERERLPQILHAVYVDFVDHRGFERICFGNQQRAFAAASRLEGHRQHAFHGANGTVERQFSYKTKIFKMSPVRYTLLRA